MSRPILFLVDDRPEVLVALAADLGRRFGGDHRILAEAGPAEALEALDELARAGEEVALVVAATCTPGPSGCCWSGGGPGLPPTRPCGP